MTTPQPRATSSVDPSGWEPPLPPAPGFEHLVVETPGLRSHVAVVGEGEPVVMLHGFPEHWWQWHVVAPLLAAAGYRVYCPDLRGSGWTVADDPRVDRESRLRDVLALLDVLEMGRPHLVSHDLGSVTAMQLTYDHPDRVRTHVQLSVPPAFMTLHPRTAGGFKHLPSFIWHRPGASMRGIFNDTYVAHPMTEATIEAHLAPMQRPEVDAAVRTLTRRIVLPEAVRIVGGHYRRRRLTVPTLFAFGRRDAFWNEEIMRLVCPSPLRYADGAELAYVDDAAHYVTDDAPEAVAALVLDWFGRQRRP